NRGGLVETRVDLYDDVEEGDPLFEVTDVFGETKEKIKSPTDGLVWRMRRLPMVATGEYVMSVASEIEELPNRPKK
ncbi:MAG: succinylglutamate desuccinylase/aspartoacylase family protein, partial [Halobacteria archaeon]|nr:succinylglutamate desuccinylase/aspartoacylase family protein [Halobacteria archaeon]